MEPGTWLLMPVYIFAGVLILIVMAGVLEKIDEFRRRKYQAEERYRVYHMGGLIESDGIRRMQKLQLFMNDQALTIKAWRKPEVIIRIRDITAVEPLWPVMLKSKAPETPEERRRFLREMQWGEELEQFEAWTHFRKTKRYLLIRYKQSGQPRTLGFGFRYGEAEEEEYEDFYKCQDSPKAYRALSRMRDSEEAVGRVSLRKKILSQEGALVWKRDPQTGRLTSEWEP
ncbi:hypothetical protein [Saccharibacillus qingshengii]|uniref:hypothetical protein n=1 Tax=Saccharibacillus qingshengii TaxID=1763540 RepID=UPI0015531618|nr:hypothetical protein [Saccharibacillus qingshengii]